MKTFFTSILFLSLFGTLALAQEQFPWPVTPFNESHLITGTFCEYRSTTNPAHFHNGTDIPKADGSPVYPVKDGVIISMETQGSNAYVRVDDKAYVHIQPNPALSVGDSVWASQTVLGTILSGMGHVHFTNGYVGSERNAMLINSGLTPLVDDWSPIIRFVRFYMDNTTTQFQSNQISGRVDIVVKVDEQNGPPGSSTSVLNNGTYKIGYRILGPDSQTVVYEPPNNGWRFQFDTKPSNSYVDIVYFQSLSSTTSHVYQVTNDVTHNNYWETSVLPEGDYVVMVFTEDTRFNADTALVRVTVAAVDTTAPARPRFKYLLGTDSDLRLSWYPNSETDLAGYRLYFSFDNVNWSLFSDETELTAARTDTILPLVLNTDAYFKLTAVDNSPLKNESKPSDVYGMSNGAAFQGKVLLVDGFDRTTGGWTLPAHSFGFTYGRAFKNNGYSFDTVPNESIEDSTIQLSDYQMVFWFVGDESTADETFSSTEQALIRQYLDNGGYLTVCGSRIAWDLDPDGAGVATPEDEAFLHDYLKADYAQTLIGVSQAVGAPGSIFAGMTIPFGQVYPVDSLDALQLADTSARPLLYASGNQIVALKYHGDFGSSPGLIIYTAIPLETIGDEALRTEVIGRFLDEMSYPLSVGSHGAQEETAVGDFRLEQNFPNPFNPSTTIRFGLPRAARVRLDIFNVRGQLVKTLLGASESALFPAGWHEVVWNGSSDAGQPVASGVYFARFRAREVNTHRQFQRTIKLLLSR